MAEEAKLTENNDIPLEPEALNIQDERKKKIRKTLMIVVPILILILSASLIYIFVFKSSPSGETANQESAPLEQIAPGKESREMNSYVDLDPITVPLLPSGTKREYLKIDLILRVGTDQESDTVVAKMPIIKDSLIGFLRSMRSTDFNGSNNAIYLKEEIAKRINKIVAPIIIKEVLFQEIVIN